jgi:hypothetical protein
MDDMRPDGGKKPQEPKAEKKIELSPHGRGMAAIGQPASGPRDLTCPGTDKVVFE